MSETGYSEEIKQYHIRPKDTLDILIPLSMDLEILNKIPQMQYQIEIFGNEIFTKKTIIVDPYGDVFLPLVGYMKVEGRTTEEVSAEIQKKLKKYIQNVRVNVLVSYYAPYYIYIFGEVKRPNKYEIEKEITAFEAIAMAGGFAKFANKKKVKVISRIKNGFKILTINLHQAIKHDSLEENIIVHNNDIIIVEEDLF